ncbi:hypothetical protein Mgra_00009677 [Meloidogyne graminicola]|uniref:Uncharacterized protein n=1 Tax=Meloidogyne graminicola TaxID=189291 RepID=A0A8S9Z8T9_9BILA|nr:hypothetical protein Mgra_00009677 [Meloidogyne graminicola]
MIWRMKAYQSLPLNFVVIFFLHLPRYLPKIIKSQLLFPCPFQILNKLIQNIFLHLNLFIKIIFWQVNPL